MRELSYQQHDLLELEQKGEVGFQPIDQRSSVNVYFALRVLGDLNIAMLQQSVSDLVERHEVLRTTIDVANGRLVSTLRAVEASPTVRVALIPISGDTTEAREQVLAARANDLALAHFDYARAPLLRVGVLQLAEDHAVVLVALPHVIGDERSLHLLREELLTLYGDGVAGRQSALPPPMQHDEWARSQRSQLRQELPLITRHFADRLSAARSVVLPVDGTDPDSRIPMEAMEVRVPLSPATTAAVSRLAARAGATTYMVCLTAFAVLVCKWTDCHDILITAQVSARQDERMQTVVGLLVSRSILRIDLSGNPNLGEALARTRNAVLDAMEFNHVPTAIWREVAEQLGGSLPVFTVATNSHVHDDPHVESVWSAVPGIVSVERYVIPVDRTRVVWRASAGLSLWVEQTPSRHAGFMLVYRADLFNRRTIECLAEAFGGYLDALLVDPSQSLDALPSVHVGHIR
jgi:hypothetical protein